MDLSNFKSELVQNHSKLDTSLDSVNAAVQGRQEILHTKTLAKLNLVLNDQITSFENALLVEVSGNEPVLRKLKTLAGLYLLITRLYTFLQLEPNEFLVKFLDGKVGLLKYEFGTYLEEVTDAVLSSTEEDSSDTVSGDEVRLLVGRLRSFM